MPEPSRPPGAPSFDRSLIEGPIPQAVWKLAWPTMLQNLIGGLQGIIDHAMVGHFVGYAGNAAIGVSWQIFLVVMIFVIGLFPSIFLDRIKDTVQLQYNQFKTISGQDATRDIVEMYHGGAVGSRESPNHSQRRFLATYQKPSLGGGIVAGES